MSDIQKDSREEITAKSSKTRGWIKSICSFIVGAAVGIASFFGVKTGQIKTQIQEVKEKIEEVKSDIENKDYKEAIDKISEIIKNLKELTGQIKDSADNAKEKIEAYREDGLAVAEAIKAKEWKTAHETATALMARVLNDFPGQSLTGAPKTIYDTLNQVIADLDAGKYDGLINLADSLIPLFTGKTAEEAAPAEAVQPAPAPEAAE